MKLQLTQNILGFKKGSLITLNNKYSFSFGATTLTLDFMLANNIVRFS